MDLTVINKLQISYPHRVAGWAFSSFPTFNTDELVRRFSVRFQSTPDQLTQQFQNALSNSGSYNRSEANNEVLKYIVAWWQYFIDRTKLNETETTQLDMDKLISRFADTLHCSSKLGFGFEGIDVECLSIA